MSAQHTPGPWQVLKRLSDAQSGMDTYVGTPDRRDEKRDYSLRYAERYIAQVFNCGDGTCDGDADATLIAAAPDLLEAAEMILSSLEWEEKRSGTTYRGYETLRAIIAKAKGQL